MNKYNHSPVDTNVCRRCCWLVGWFFSVRFVFSLFDFFRYFSAFLHWLTTTNITHCTPYTCNSFRHLKIYAKDVRCAFSLLLYNLRLCYALFPSHSTKYVLIRFMKNIIFIISPVGSLITCKKKTFSQKFKLRRCDRPSSVHNLNTATTFSFLYCILAVFFTRWPPLSRSQLIPTSRRNQQKRTATPTTTTTVDVY